MQAALRLAVRLASQAKSEAYGARRCWRARQIDTPRCVPANLFTTLRDARKLVTVALKSDRRSATGHAGLFNPGNGICYIITTPLQRGRLSQLTHVGIVIPITYVREADFIRLRIRSKSSSARVRARSPLCSAKAPIIKIFVMNKNALTRNIRSRGEIDNGCHIWRMKKNTVSLKLLTGTLFAFRSIRSPMIMKINV